MDNPDFISLRQIMTGWIRWYRLRRAFTWSGTGLIAGASLALAGAFYPVSQGWLLRSEFYLGFGSAALVSALAAALIGYLWPTPPHTAARVFDRAFDLHERLSTALELAPLSSCKGSIPELISLQLSDTLQHVRIINPRRFLPLYVRKINGTIMLLLTIVTILISWRGTPWFTAAAEQHQVEQAITNQIERIQALHANIQSDNHLTPQGQQELLQILDQTTRRLEQASTLEEALSILSEAQQALRALSDPQTQSLSQALRSIGTSLSQQANSPLAPVGQQLASGDYASAAQVLTSIDPSTLTPDEYQSLTEQISEAAQALQSSAPDLSESLNQAAQALQAGDDQAAQEALADAARTLQQASGQIAASHAAQQAANQIAASQQQLLQAGEGEFAQSGQAGQDASNQASQGEASGGAGRGDSESGDVTGPEAGDVPISQDNDPGDGGVSPYQPLYPPDRLGGESDDLITLPSNNETGELILGQGDIAPGEFNLTSVPYSQVYAYYSRVYRQAIENGIIPSAMRSLVLDYFTSLEP